MPKPGYRVITISENIYGKLLELKGKFSLKSINEAIALLLSQPGYEIIRVSRENYDTLMLIKNALRFKSLDDVISILLIEFADRERKSIVALRYHYLNTLKNIADIALKEIEKLGDVETLKSLLLGNNKIRALLEESLKTER